jgi:hypothetical protein
MLGGCRGAGHGFAPDFAPRSDFASRSTQRLQMLAVDDGLLGRPDGIGHVLAPAFLVQP